MRIVISTSKSESWGLGVSGTHPDMLSLFNTAAFALALLPKSAEAFLLPCLFLLLFFLLSMVRSPLRLEVCDGDGADPVLFQVPHHKTTATNPPSPFKFTTLGEPRV